VELLAERLLLPRELALGPAQRLDARSDLAQRCLGVCELAAGVLDLRLQGSSALLELGELSLLLGRNRAALRAERLLEQLMDRARLDLHALELGLHAFVVCFQRVGDL